MLTNELKTYIRQVPKAELHMHLEGSLEPELMFEIAQRNGILLPYNTIEELKSAYRFGNLQDFLDMYYQGANVLIHEADFYDLTMAYFRKCKADNVVHTEMFIDPQTHTERGVSIETVLNGIFQAQEQARRELGITSYLIVCFLRHLSEDSARETLKEILPFKDRIIGVGLDSSETGNPPEKFKNVFREAAAEGFRLVAHAGEEGPAEYIRRALKELNAERIDHGIRSIDDEKLMEYLAEKKIPLTVCPLSNLELKVVNDLKEHPLKKLLLRGLLVTINSDDPAYFGGYAKENFLRTADALDLTKEEIREIGRNSFTASFLPEDEKNRWLSKI